MQRCMEEWGTEAKIRCSKVSSSKLYLCMTPLALGEDDYVERVKWKLCVVSYGSSCIVSTIVIVHICILGMNAESMQ